MAKTKRPPKKPAKKSRPRDNTTAIIRECVTYAQNVAAFHATFDARPTESDEMAEHLGNSFGDAACRSLEKLGRSEMLATTPLAIEAKARIVKMILEDNGLSMEPREKAFFELFGFEVHNYLAGINGREWQEKNKQQQEQDQKKGGAS